MTESAPERRDDGAPPAPDQADLFGALGISDALVRAIKELGFEEPTPIQTQAVPAALAGRDVIGQAQTGTGKTAAFGLPLVERVDPADRRVQAVILCPTRELAVQVAEELFKLARFRRGVTVLPIYGGQQIERQIAALRKGVQIVIGTPGRVLDHIHRRTLQLDAVRFAVLDEADEMLDMGFRDDITEILDQTPKDRQTLLFSATLSPEILHLAQRYLHDPVEVRTVHRELTVPLTEQVYFEVRESDKIEALSRLLDLSEGEKGLVFCNTKRGVDEVVSQLRTRGYAAEGLHGDMKQNQRDRVMARFRQGAIDLLVATDVAARGIDVTDITTVYNYDMPQDEEYYVHRIGRTGRAGKTGKAYTFVTGREHWKLRDIQKYTKTKIVQRQPAEPGRRRGGPDPPLRGPAPPHHRRGRPREAGRPARAPDARGLLLARDRRGRAQAAGGRGRRDGLGRRAAAHPRNGSARDRRRPEPERAPPGHPRGVRRGDGHPRRALRADRGRGQ